MHPGPFGNRADQQIAVTLAVAIAWSLAMVWLCWSGGVQLDYPYYLQHWARLVRGADPWLPSNTYGPLYTMVGVVLPLGKLAPKFFMVGALLLANVALVVELVRRRGLSPLLIVYVLAIPTNVLAIVVGVVYGFNDALVAALLVLAVLLRHRGHFVFAGVAIGLAALTKYYPLALLPFFALDGRRLNWSLIVSGVVVFGVGMAAGIAVWGSGPINAILYNSARGPKLLSILAALTTSFGEEAVSWLARYNTYFVMLAVASTFLIMWALRVNWLGAVVLGYLVMLTTYKVGHAQFYMPWLFMVASLPLVNERETDRMALIFLPAVLLLSLFMYGYAYCSDYYISRLMWVRSYGGYLALPVAAASIAACMIDFRKSRRLSAVTGPPISRRRRGRISSR